MALLRRISINIISFLFILIGTAIPSFALNYNIKNNAQSFLFVNGTSGNVGVGTTVPVAKMEVVGTGTSAGIAFQVDNGLYAPKVTVLDNGRVGVGTWSPAYTLEVFGDIRSSANLRTGTTAQLLTNNIQVNSSANPFQIVGGVGAIDFILKTKASMAESFRISAAGNLGVGSYGPRAKLEVVGDGSSTGASFQIDDNLYNPRVTVLDNGNIGVGTVMPVAGLHVGAGSPTLGADLSSSSALIKGNLEVDGKLYGDGSMLTGINAISGLSGAAGYGKLPRASSSATLVDSVIYQDVNGNIGIGTTAPSQKFEVSGDLRIAGSGDSYFNGNLGVGVSSPTQAVDVAGTVRATAFVGDGSLLTGITSSQWSGTAGSAIYYNSANVGIGSSVPRAKLEIVGSGSTTGTAFQIDDNLYNPKLTVLDNGNVGIGTISPADKLEIVGNVRANNYSGLGANATTFLITDYYIALNESLSGALALYNGAFYPLSGQALDLGNSTRPWRSAYLSGNVGVSTIAPLARLHVGAGTPNAFDTSKTTNAYIAGDLEVDGKIYGDGSGLSNLSGMLSGLNSTRVPVASGSTTLVDSGIYYLNGNVGIGSSDPGNSLDVVGSIRSSGTALFSGVQLASGNIQLAGGNQIMTSSSTSSFGFAVGGNAGTGLTIATRAGQGLFYLNLNNGNVGVGTSTPQAKMEIVASGSTTGTVFQIDDSLYSPKVTVLDNGNVGIGTTTPVDKIDIDGGALYIHGTANTGNLLINNNDSVGPYLAAHTNGANASTYNVASSRWVASGYGHMFQTSPAAAVGAGRSWTTRMLIQAGWTGTTAGDVAIGGSIAAYNDFTGAALVTKSGNIGIGTIGPRAKLEITGSGSTTGVSFQIDDNAYNPKVTVLDNGNVGIGTLTPLGTVDIGVNANAPAFMVSSNNGNATHGDYMIVTSYGNVGIGTYRPRGTLQLGDHTGYESFVLGGANGMANSAELKFVENAAGSAYSIRHNSSTNELIMLGILDGVDNKVAFRFGRDSGNVTLSPDVGNVGIGTTVSLAKLHVGVGGSTRGADLSSNSALIRGNLEVDGKIYGDGSLLTGISGAITGLTTYAVPRASSATTIIDSGIYLDANGNVGVGAVAPSAPLTLVRADSSGQNDLLINPAIKSSGNLFLAQVNGTLKYSVAYDGSMNSQGNIDATGNIRAQTNSVTLGILNLYTGLHSASDINLTHWNGSAWVSQATFALNGNVGISTTVPRAKLEVVASGSTTGTAFQIDDSNYSPKVTVLDNGSVGIGTENPTFTLHVIGTMKVSNLAYFVSPIEARGGVATDAAPYLTISGGTSGNTYFSGNIGVGSTSPVARFQVGAGSPNAFDTSKTTNAYIAGDLEVDGKIYGDGSGLTGVSGSISGLTTYAVPRASSATTIVDSGIYLDANGNVGVGTSLPSYNFDVKGTAQFQTVRIDTLQLVGASAPRTISSGSQGGALITSTNGGLWTGYWAVSGGDSAGASGASLFLYGKDHATYPNMGRYLIDSLEKIRINASGNVGIGTIGPRAKLEIVGSGSTTGTAFQIDDNLYNPKVTVLDNGNVGIGTAMPSGKLEISGTSPQVNITAISGNPRLRLTDDPVSPNRKEVYLEYSVSGDYAFIQSIHQNSQATPLVLQVSGGNVGISTTSPVTKFQVGAGTPSAFDATKTTNAYIAGDLEVDGKIYGDGSGLTGVSGSISGLTTYAVPRASSSTTIVDSGIYLDANGNVGIGTTSPGAVLELGSGQITVPSGSVSAPSYTFAADITTGIYYPGSNNLGITAGGVSVARFLTVGPLMEVGTSGGGSVQFGKSGGNGVLIMRNGSGVVQNSLMASGINYINGGNVGIGTTVPAGLLDVNRVLTVLAGGNVGIGTIGPRAKLEVVGAGSTTGTAFQIDDNLYNPKVTVLDNGNVGIGMINPAYLLDIYGTGHMLGLRVANDIILENTGQVYGSRFGSGNATALQLYTNAIERVRIDTLGNVSIGTTESIALLHVGPGTPNAFDTSKTTNAYIAGDLEVDGKIYGDGSMLTGVSSISGLSLNYITRAGSTSSIVDSAIYQEGSNIGIGTTSAGALLTIGTTSPTITAGALPVAAFKGNVMVDGDIYTGSGSITTSNISTPSISDASDQPTITISASSVTIDLK